MEINHSIDVFFDSLFDADASDGLSDDVYQKMVLVVSFLSKHYKDIPGDIFHDYLFTTMQILDIKDKKFPERVSDTIPLEMLDDLRSISTP